MGYLRDLFKKKDSKNATPNEERKPIAEKNVEAPAKNAVRKSQAREELTTKVHSMLLEEKQYFHSLDGVTIHLLLNVQFSPSGIRAWRATAGRNFGNEGIAGDIDLGMFGVNSAMDAFKAREIAQNLSIECDGCHRSFNVNSLSLDLSGEGKLQAEGKVWPFSDLTECPFCMNERIIVRLADSGTLRAGYKVIDFPWLE